MVLGRKIKGSVVKFKYEFNSADFKTPFSYMEHKEKK